MIFHRRQNFILLLIITAIMGCSLQRIKQNNLTAASATGLEYTAEPVENEKDTDAVDSPDPVLFNEAEDEEDMPSEIELRPQFPMSAEFCAQWNPEYESRGRICCAKTSFRGKRVPRACERKRRASGFCKEMTEVQKLMLGQHLELLDRSYLSTGHLPELGSPQAMCGADNGFLSHGVPIMPTPENRILMNHPGRCAYFGSTGLALLLHRLGKSIHERFKNDPPHDGVRLVLGDLSAPRGGCLPTRRGSHSGHTNGLDADIAFLEAHAGHDSNRIFQRRMDANLNWWFVKTMIEVSPVCVQYIFLDRNHIKSLKQAAFGDPLWARVEPLMKHISGHKNHYHLRVGLRPRTKDEFSCRKLNLVSQTATKTDVAGF